MKRNDALGVAALLLNLVAFAIQPLNLVKVFSGVCAIVCFMMLIGGKK